MLRADLPLITTVVLLLCSVLERPAKAIVVFDNGAPSKSGGFLSDDDSGFRFADDFVLAAPESINAIRFWGFYGSADTPPAADAFTVIFYADSGGLPDGSNVLATHFIGDPGRTDTGDDTDGAGLNIYVYQAPFSDLALGAGHYWVSVYNNTAADIDDNWAWARHSFPGNDARSLDSGVTWLHEFSDSELAFQLLRVPEPATPTLALVAVGLLGAYCQMLRIGMR